MTCFVLANTESSVANLQSGIFIQVVGVLTRDVHRRELLVNGIVRHDGLVFGVARLAQLALGELRLLHFGSPLQALRLAA